MAIDVQDELFTTLTGPAPDLADVNGNLTLQRYLDLCFSIFGCDTLYYGQLSGNAGGGLAADVPSDVSSGWDFNLHARGDAGFFRNVAPHEVGHSIGLHHSVQPPVVGGLKNGPCTEVALAAAPDYPYFGSVGGRDRSLLGPDGAGDDDQNWGVDTRFVRVDVNNLAVIPPIGPNATFDMMGYCWIAAPQDTWPSDHTWALAKAGLDGRFGATVSSLAATTTGEHLVFTGRIDVGTGAATIASPALVSGELPTPAPGDYELRLLDDGGAELAAVPFAATSDSSGRPGTESPTVVLPNSMFVVPVLRPASAVARVQVWHGGTMVGETVASPGVPTVSTTEPVGGSTQSGQTVHFEWTGSDPDGDSLTYHVRYSHDGGGSWETLAVGFAGTSFDVPRSTLTGGTSAIFQVQASDGLNLSSADSPPFTVEGSGPVVDIASPVDGETFYSGVQQVILDATATDNEDGDASASIVWTSDVDGQVFAGPNGSVGADTLSEGVHVLTATATDSGGATGSASVQIEVFRVAPPPPPTTAPTATRLASSANPSVVGQPVTFTATVSSTEPGTPTGTVTFADGSTPLGSAPVTGGTASITTSSLSPGDHQVTAAYGGDAAFDPSTSPVLVQTVNRAATSLVADPLINLSRPFTGGFGQFRATLTRSDPAGPVAGETVHFLLGSREVCQATTDASGVASCPSTLGSFFVALFTGGYTARFDGNTDLLPSSARGAAIGFR